MIFCLWRAWMQVFINEVLLLRLEARPVSLKCMEHRGLVNILCQSRVLSRLYETHWGSQSMLNRNPWFINHRSRVYRQYADGKVKATTHHGLVQYVTQNSGSWTISDESIPHNREKHGLTQWTPDRLLYMRLSRGIEETTPAFLNYIPLQIHMVPTFQVFQKLLKAWDLGPGVRVFVEFLSNIFIYILCYWYDFV